MAEDTAGLKEGSVSAWGQGQVWWGGREWMLEKWGWGGNPWVNGVSGVGALRLLNGGESGSMWIQWGECGATWWSRKWVVHVPAQQEVTP